MPDVRELKDQAAKHFSKGKFDKAATAYAELCRLEPRDLQLRVRLGDSFVKQGDKAAAIGAYRFAAESYAKEGFLPRAIAVCKLILEVDPSHQETQHTLAQLYAKKSGGARPAAPAPAAAPRATAGEPAPAGRGIPDAPRVVKAALGSASEEASGLELDTSTDGSWRAQQTSWEPPETDASAAPAAKAALARKPQVIELDAPPTPAADRAGVEAILAPPAASPVVAAHPAPADAVRPAAANEAVAPEEVLLFEEAPAAAVAFTELDLGEPELVPELAPAAAASPRTAAEPAKPRRAAVASTSIPLDDGPEAALESAWGEPADATSAGASAPVGPAAGEQNWFAPPEAGAPSSLAELRIAAVDEDLEIEVLAPVSEARLAASLPEIPLFSDLSREAFIDLASRCTLRRLAPGEAAVEEGSVGSSFFVVCSGKVKVSKRSGQGDVALASLSDGAFFGEMALLSGAPRTASVVAECETECLEFSAALIADLVRRYPHVGQVLKKFCRQRLLANVMAASPLFRPFDKEVRRTLVEKFKAREVASGEAVVAEGRLSEGLFVVMAGELEVRKEKDGAAVRLATLKQGDLFGEISLLTKSAATATVVASQDSTVLRLPRETFDELISAYPQILALVSDLTDERLKGQQVLAGEAADGLDGLMLV